MKKLPVAGPTYDYKLENIRNDIIEQELALTHRKLENIELGAGDLIYTDDSGNQKTFRTLQTAVDDPTTGLSANATAISGLETRVTTAEGNITSQATDITTLQTDLTSAESDIAANSSAVTTLTSSVSTLDGEVSALSSSVTSLSTTVGTNTTNITTNTSSINGIEGKYAVKINNNGHVSGFGLISTANNATPTSTFTVTADAFKIVDTSGAATPTSPFEVYTSARVVDGVTVPAGVYMENANITAANIKTLDATTITTGTLNADRINLDGSTITVSGGQLVVGSINANQVGDGTLSTARLPGLTFQEQYYGASEITITGGDPREVVAFCNSYSYQGGNVILSFTCNVKASVGVANVYYTTGTYSLGQTSSLGSQFTGEYNFDTNAAGRVGTMLVPVSGLTANTTYSFAVVMRCQVTSPSSNTRPYNRFLQVTEFTK